VNRPEKQSLRFPGISYAKALVARVIRVGEVPGSNPGAPIARPQGFSRPTASVLTAASLRTAAAVCGLDLMIAPAGVIAVGSIADQRSPDERSGTTK
jgi:hypothetical protein